jgi:hypothetical protein
MTRQHHFERALSDWLHDDDAPAVPAHVYETAFAQTRMTRRARPIPAPIARWLPMSTTFGTPVTTLQSRWTMLAVTALVTLALVAAVLSAGSTRRNDGPGALPGVFEPIGSLPGTLQPGDVVTSAVTLADGGALAVAGGQLVRFDPATNAFTTVGALGTRRMSESTVRLQDERVLIVGGDRDGEGVPPTEGYRAELYDPATDAVAWTGSTVEPRVASAATVLRDGTVLITGGDGQDSALASAELYDPESGLFSATGSMSSGRSHHSSVLLPDGRVLVVGGTGSDLHVSAEVYDPATDTFSPTGPLAYSQTGLTAAVLLDGRVLLAGGTRGSSPGLTSAAQIYDPETGQFSGVGSLPAPRRGHAAATLADGRVLIVGGVLDLGLTSNVTSAASLFDPATSRFSPAGAMTEARTDFHALTLDDGRVLILGHHSWRLNPASRRGPGPPPPDPYAEEERIRRSAEVYR